MKIKFSAQHQDMLLLKWPVLVLVVAMLASALWCGGLYQFRQSEHRAMLAAQANRIQTETSVRQLKDDEKTIHDYIDRYRMLATNRVIGDEDRLELVEAIGRIRARHNLYPVQLDIGQQAIVPLGQDGGQGNGVSLRVSRIQLTIHLLHEEDLSHLLNDLRDLKLGMFVVETCTIKRTGSGSGSDHLELHENLTAFCKILWLTLNQEKGDGGHMRVNTGQEPANTL